MGDELSLWNDTPTRAAILKFVAQVTDPAGAGFVPEADRVATFDNDGTLWCEKPLYVQADFLFRRWGEQAKADPARARQQPWKAIVEGDHAWLAGLQQHLPELVKGVSEAYDGITVEAFEQAVTEFFKTAKHPTLGVPYTQVGYAPMKQLIAHLAANGFQVHICSAGGRDFMRVIGEEMYDVPRERVIGSGTTLEYREDGGVYRTAGVEQPVDDGSGKPVHIWTRIGRHPLLAAGNADGDIAMLSQATFSLLVHHDDADREFAYDAGAEKALAAAAQHAWTVVSVKDDFSRVF